MLVWRLFAFTPFFFLVRLLRAPKNRPHEESKGAEPVALSFKAGHGEPLNEGALSHKEDEHQRRGDNGGCRHQRPEA